MPLDESEPAGRVQSGSGCCSAYLGALSPRSSRSCKSLPQDHNLAGLLERTARICRRYDTLLCAGRDHLRCREHQAAINK